MNGINFVINISRAVLSRVGEFLNQDFVTRVGWLKNKGIYVEQ